VFGSLLHRVFGYVSSGSSCSPLARDLGSCFSSGSSVSPCSPSAHDSGCSFSSDSSISTAAVTACLVGLLRLVSSSVLPCAQSACNLGSSFSSDSSVLMAAVEALHRASSLAIPSYQRRPSSLRSRRPSSLKCVKRFIVSMIFDKFVQSLRVVSVRQSSLSLSQQSWDRISWSNQTNNSFGTQSKLKLVEL